MCVRTLQQTIVSLVAAVSVSTIAAIPLQAQKLDQVRSNSRVMLVLSDTVRQQPLFAARQILVGNLTRVSADSAWIRMYTVPQNLE